MSAVRVGHWRRAERLWVGHERRDERILGRPPVALNHLRRVPFRVSVPFRGSLLGIGVWAP